MLADWLAARAPQPPPALVERMRVIVADRRCVVAELSDTLVEAAVTVFQALSDDRDSAIDLLAADALITYAMEAAADNAIDHAASSAIERIANAVTPE